MQSSLLHVIVPIFNPCRRKSHEKNARKFLKHLVHHGVQAWVVECTYGDSYPAYANIPGINHIHVKAHTVLWIKEKLVNLAIARLPHSAKYIAWIDADIEFLRPTWAEDTVHALQHHEFVQPWEHCVDLGPEPGQILDTHYSFCRQWRKERHTTDKLGKSGYRFAHPGFAWAATRSALEHVGGLIETAALGAGDHHQALALIGKAAQSIPGGLPEGYAKPILEWERRAVAHVRGNIGFVPGTIQHSYHGPKPDRNYIGRWAILQKNGFDPATDLKINTYGVWELAGNKPELRRDIHQYFNDRNEDHTILID